MGEGVSMAIRKWATKKEIESLIKTYSIRPDEIEPFGDEGYSFKSKLARGYVISIKPEVQHGNVETGRIIISHTKSNGKRTFQDVWERDSGGNLQFAFRNPWDKPFADYDYIRETKDRNTELENTVHEIKQQLKKYQKLINNTKRNARGAGRKADLQHLKEQVAEVQLLLEEGKNSSEIQRIMGISRSSYFRYKRFIKNK